MAFEKPEYSRNQVKKAGEILKNQDAFTLREILYAHEVLVNWRASHLYPINTFQSLLRKNIAQIDSDALVAQRLKRTPSIVAMGEGFHECDGDPVSRDRRCIR